MNKFVGRQRELGALNRILNLWCMHDDLAPHTEFKFLRASRLRLFQPAPSELNGLLTKECLHLLPAYRP